MTVQTSCFRSWFESLSLILNDDACDESEKAMVAAVAAVRTSIEYRQPASSAVQAGLWSRTETETPLLRHSGHECKHSERPQ